VNYPVTVIIKFKEIKEIKEHKLEKLEIKEHKFEKLEIKEHKLEVKEHKLEIKELEKQITEGKLKDAESIDPQLGGGDPALAAAFQELHTRIDALTEAVQEQQRSAITPEERPEVGDAALRHSTKKLKE
jgi:hypothetical protein